MVDPQPARWPRSILLLGAGRMGGALLRGWLARGFEPGRISVVDPQLGPEMAQLCAASGVQRRAPDQPAEVVMLAIKPQVFSAKPHAFAGYVGSETLVLSVLAGKTLADLRAGFPAAGAVVRAMPNLPASVGRGVTALSAASDLAVEHRAVAQTLLEAVGLVEWLDEALIDAVTAVSGSGPAYVFLLVEALAAAGEKVGLPPPVAMRLARTTVEGAGELLASQPGVTAAALREAVTSPGGTTAAALAVLRADDALGALFDRAVGAATTRAAELAG